jgi:hypothetical protein
MITTGGRRSIRRKACYGDIYGIMMATKRKPTYIETGRDHTFVNAFPLIINDGFLYSVYFANLDSYITAYQTQKVNVRNIAFRDVT